MEKWLQELSLTSFSSIMSFARTKTKYHLALKLTTFYQATQPFQNLPSSYTVFWMVLWRGCVPFHFCFPLLRGCTLRAFSTGLSNPSEPTQAPWPCPLNPGSVALFFSLPVPLLILCSRVLQKLKSDLVACAPKPLVAICGYRVRSKFWNMAFKIHSTLSYT